MLAFWFKPCNRNPDTEPGVWTNGVSVIYTQLAEGAPCRALLHKSGEGFIS
jgi:hypothetical protein